MSVCGLSLAFRSPRPWREGKYLLRHILRRRNQGAGPVSPRLIICTRCGGHDGRSVEVDREGDGLEPEEEGSLEADHCTKGTYVSRRKENIVLDCATEACAREMEKWCGGVEVEPSDGPTSRRTRLRPRANRSPADYRVPDLAFSTPSGLRQGYPTT